MPAARVTGMCSLEGKTAVAATTSGLNEPVSAESTVEETAPISLRPICVTASKRPGETCKPLASMTCAPAGNSTGGPKAPILPALVARVPAAIVEPARVAGLPGGVGGGAGGGG